MTDIPVDQLRKLLHDLRNPLGTARMGTTLLQRALAEDDPAQEKVDLVLRAIDAALDIVEREARAR